MVRLAAVLLVLSLAGQARATSTVYTDRASWEAAVSGAIYTETFDAVPLQQDASIHTPAFDLTDAPGGFGMGIVDGVDVNGSRGFRGNVNDGTPFDAVDVSFAAPIIALGFDIGNTEHNGLSPIGLHVAGGTYSLAAHSFFGIVSGSAFASAQFFDILNSPKHFDLDNLSVAPVPEPEALGALAALLLATRRRSTAG